MGLQQRSGLLGGPCTRHGGLIPHGRKRNMKAGGWYELTWLIFYFRGTLYLARHVFGEVGVTSCEKKITREAWSSGQPRVPSMVG